MKHHHHHHHHHYHPKQHEVNLFSCFVLIFRTCFTLPSPETVEKIMCRTTEKEKLESLPSTSTSTPTSTSTTYHRLGEEKEDEEEYCGGKNNNNKDNNNDDTRNEITDIDDDDGNDDDEFSFPHEELSVLYQRFHSMSQRQQQQQQQPQPPKIIDKIPTTCGIMQNLQLIGIFPTSRWLKDPTMPPDVKEMFGGTPFFPLGEYRVATCDIQDAAGYKKSLILIVNTGVKGMLTGYWGGAFSREEPYSCWARFKTTGEFETTVVGQQSKRKRYGEEWHFHEFESLDFDEERFTGNSSSSSNGDGDGDGSIVPGKCATQFERLLGTTVEFLLDLDWAITVPEAMIEVCDLSPRMERRNRARRRATPRTQLDRKAFSF